MPTYNPWVVYGQPIMAYPGYQPIDTVGAVVGSAVQFGLGFAVGAFLQMPFGLSGSRLGRSRCSVRPCRVVLRSVSVRDWGFLTEALGISTVATVAMA